MAYARRSPYLHATWISRYLTGDKSCLWACWFKANYQGYDRMPSDFDVARWTMEHTDLLNKLIADLEEQGCELFIEHQNGFRVESSRSGAVIGGRADLIARFPDGRTGRVRREDRTGGGIAHRTSAALHVSAAEVRSDEVERDTGG